MNSTFSPRLEVIFVERGICGSHEQCTRLTQGNADADSNANVLLSKPTLGLCLGSAFPSGSVFSCGSHALFTGPTSTMFCNFFFKIGSHDTIHTFKNYFTTVFSVFNF